MGYQLVIWEGERPESDAAAGEKCRELMSRYYVGEGCEPTPAIREFVAALTAIWPDDPDSMEWDNVPWKFPPILDDASGPLLFLNMRFGAGEAAAYRIAELAEEHGLVTFDTYVEVMRPWPPKVIEQWNARLWAQFLTNMPTVPANPTPEMETMGYHLIVWEGTRPADDPAGQQACRDLTLQFGSAQTEPTPAIREFVDALTQTWPDDAEHPRWDSSPWQSPSILDGASGPVLFLRLLPETGVLAGCVVAAMAEERGLVVYDPQVGMLRPVSEEVIEAYQRRWTGALN